MLSGCIPQEDHLPGIGEDLLGTAPVASLSTMQRVPFAAYAGRKGIDQGVDGMVNPLAELVEIFAVGTFAEEGSRQPVAIGIKNLVDVIVG